MQVSHSILIITNVFTLYRYLLNEPRGFERIQVPMLNMIEIQ